MQEIAVSGRRPEGKRLGWYWHFELRRGEYGRSLGLEDESWDIHNALLDEGERNVLDSYFRNTNNPPEFFVGLHSGSLAETATLANIVEPSQLGYARQQVPRSTVGWPVLALDAGDFQAESTTEVFTAAATWTPVNKMFLASTSTGSAGSIILEADLSTLRALVSQDTLNVTTRAKAQ